MVKDMVRILQEADIRLVDLADAKAEWRRFRLANGLSATCPPLFSDEEGNLKLGKSADKLSIHTFGLSLAPAKSSGNYNVCRYATKCADSCVAYAGNGFFPKVQQARVIKTKFLAEYPSAFITLVVDEIRLAVNKHGNVAVRLNTFSDVSWETIVPWLFQMWDGKVTFYDYTKWPADKRPEVDGYDLTRSANEKMTDNQVRKMLADGHRVAVCVDVKKNEMPETYLGFTTVDGDKHDARFTEDKGVVVILRPKGSARKGGFVRPFVP